MNCYDSTNVIHVYEEQLLKQLFFFIKLNFNSFLYLFEGMVKQVKNAKIALLDFSLQKAKMKMGVQILVSDPEKLEGLRQRYVCFESFIFMV